MSCHVAPTEGEWDWLSLVKPFWLSSVPSSLSESLVNVPNWMCWVDGRKWHRPFLPAQISLPTQYTQYVEYILNSKNTCRTNDIPKIPFSLRCIFSLVLIVNVVELTYKIMMVNMVNIVSVKHQHSRIVSMSGMLMLAFSSKGC